MATVLELPTSSLEVLLLIVDKPACIFNLNLISHFKGLNPRSESYVPDEKDLYQLGKDEMVTLNDVVKMLNFVEKQLEAIKSWPEQADEKYGTYTYFYEGISKSKNEKYSFELDWGT